ncbi:MAG: DUF4924 family protein [Paludibacteraceae bacterium]|nr:DUF4924 family protein [Paludibacteraceae bacterium]
MIIAKQKKKENIVEYVLYMWQVEDLIRACKFDINVIQTGIIEQFAQPDDIKQEMRDWYQSFINMMQEEHVTEKGHTQIIKNIVNDMNGLHMEMLQSHSQTDYNVIFFNTLPYLSEYRQKSGAGEDVNDIELCLNLLYQILLLRLQKKEISTDTMNVVSQVSKLMAVFAAKYKKDENGELKL